MTPSSETSSSRILDPLERSSEIMFGLIMALTFTSAVSVASTTLDVRTMLVSALGCNIAWGLIDGAMYVLSQLVTRQRQRSFAIAIAHASPPEARKMILGRLPDGLESHLSPSELDGLAAGIRALQPPSQTLLPHRDDLRGAAGIFLLVFLSTLPVALPFMIFGNVATALRTSNVIAIVLLYVVGARLGRHMGWPSPWAVGLGVALFGAILVAIAISLGG
jgi:hypothetical protein